MPHSSGEYGRWTLMVKAIQNRSHFFVSFFFVAALCSSAYFVYTLLPANVYTEITVKGLFILSVALIAPSLYKMLVSNYKDKYSSEPTKLEGKEAEEALRAAEKVASEAAEELLRLEEEELKKKERSLNKEGDSGKGRGGGGTKKRI